MDPKNYSVEELVEALRDYADHDCFSDEQFKTRKMCWELAERIEKSAKGLPVKSERKHVEYFACPKCNYILMREVEE